MAANIQSFPIYKIFYKFRRQKQLDNNGRAERRHRNAASPATVPARRRSSAYVIALSCVAAIGGFLFGFDSGVINGAVDALAKAFGTQAAGTGFAVASVLLGCAVGAFGAGTLADSLGRRPTMLFERYPLFRKRCGDRRRQLGWVFHRCADRRRHSHRRRQRIGPDVHRGSGSGAHAGPPGLTAAMAIVSGLFGAFLSNDILARLAGGASAIFWVGAPTWRWMFWMEAVPAAAFLMGTMLIPESPRFLIFRGKHERAREIFARIGADAEKLVREVEQSLKGEHRPRLSDLIIPGTRRIAPVLWVGMGLAAFQQFVGINIIFYYGEILWKAAGATEQWALRINLLTGLVNILATIPAIMLVDRIGRKPLLLVGSVGMALTLGAMAVVFGTASVGPDGKPLLSHMAAVAGLTAANLYIVAFAMSWGPVMWVLLGEMFPNQLRGAALAVSGATNWAG